MLRGNQRPRRSRLQSVDHDTFEMCRPRYRVNICANPGALSALVTRVLGGSGVLAGPLVLIIPLDVVQT